MKQHCSFASGTMLTLAIITNKLTLIEHFIIIVTVSVLFPYLEEIIILFMHLYGTYKED